MISSSPSLTLCRVLPPFSERQVVTWQQALCSPGVSDFPVAPSLPVHLMLQRQVKELLSLLPIHTYHLFTLASSWHALPSSLPETLFPLSA